LRLFSALILENICNFTPRIPFYRRKRL
jgi:hypothetical protein